MPWPICQSERMLGDVSCLCKAMLQGQRSSLTGQSRRPRGGSHKPSEPGQCACWHFSFLISHKYFSFNRASVRMKRKFLFLDFVILCLKIPSSLPITHVKDRLAKLFFSPPLYPSFYKQKNTNIAVVSSRYMKSICFPSPDRLMLLPLELRIPSSCCSV